MADPDAQAQAVADVIEAVVRAALAPVLARLRALEPLVADVQGTRERVASLDARAPVPGPPGPAGADGLGFDDYEVRYDGDRTLTHRWARGERSGEQVIKIPTPIYRGVFVPGHLYERGDLVTVDGSMWHANSDTTARPGEAATAADWTLAVKRGRDRWVK